MDIALLFVLRIIHVRKKYGLYFFLIYVCDVH